MIHLLSLVILGSSAEIGSEEAVQRAIAFGKVVAVAFKDLSNMPVDVRRIWREKSPQTSVQPYERWEIQFPYFSCGVDVIDGMIRSFSLDVPSTSISAAGTGSEMEITAKLPELANKYARLAGSPYDIRILETYPWFDNSRRVHHVSFTHRIENVTFPRFPGGSMVIDGATGGLIGLVLRRPVDPPKDLKPRVDSEAALAAVVGRVFSDRRKYAADNPLFNMNPPAVVEAVEGPELSLWKPDAADTEDGGAAVTHEMATLGKANKAVLTYWVMLVDSESYSPAIGTYSRRYAAHIDAANGRVLSFVQYRPGGGGGEAPKSVPTPTRPPMRLAPTRLWVFDVGGKNLEVANAGWDSAGGIAPEGGLNVRLRLGNQFWNCSYTEGANLLVMRTKSGPVVLRPNDALRRALQAQAAHQRKSP